MAERITKPTQRLVAEQKLEPFFNGVDEFCKCYVPEGEPRIVRHKIIADPVEDYCSLEPWEVSIVDTPIFQRLRGIRQLGLAYLVYPTLGYSRFEHVLGARARLDQVVTTLSQNQTLRAKRQIPLPTSKQLTSSRLAALCHDIGHCLFSHVSESIIDGLPGNKNYPSAPLLKEHFGLWAGREVPISEILSVAIVTSPVFIKYLHAAAIPGSSRLLDAERIAFEAAHLIAGLPIPDDPDSLFLGQLLNSGFDVDKLDYMLREALLSGISLGISLPWLMRKLFIAFLHGAQLPKDLVSRTHSFPKESQFAVLSLERGGQFGFEEFCIARLALHEKIYLHQQIRAAEVQTKKILAEIPLVDPAYNEAHRWLYLCESVVNPVEGELPMPGLPLFENPPFSSPSRLGWSRIRHRQLPARAYAFGWQNSISDPLTQDFGNEPRKTAVDSLIILLEENPSRFTDEIREYLKRIAAALEDKLDVSLDPTKVEILVDPPRTKTLQQGHDTIHIEYPSRLSRRWTMPIDQVEQYYHSNRALGYVFTEREHAPYVLLAAEMAAWKLCGVVCVQEGLVSRDSVERCKEIRKTLTEKNFYADAPPLRPISDYLDGVEAQIKIDEIARKLSAYESKTQKRVTPASVTTFVSQFPIELQEAALSWLSCIELIRPEGELKQLIPTTIRDHLPKCKSIGISPLGATTDSAFRLAYNLRDALDEVLQNEVLAQHLPLPDALGRELDAYIIFDDNTNSGLQALNIFAGWLEIELPEPLRLREEHVLPLSEPLRTELRKKPLILVFSVATQDALGKLKNYLIRHCKMGEESIECRAGRNLRAEDKIFSERSKFQDKRKVQVEDFVRDVARTIFLAEGKTEENALARSLGVCDAQAMVVFPYNCPTMTIPALWLSGRYHGTDWMPLVERGRRRAATEDLVGEDA
ncbi:MAG: hypothetical protein ABSD88_02630 [Candidatus Korobacteraceae bacterium]